MTKIDFLQGFTFSDYTAYFDDSGEVLFIKRGIAQHLTRANTR